MVTESKASQAGKPAVSVDAEIVRRAAAFVAVADVRTALTGVCVKPSKSGGALVIASNGHVAIVLHDPNGSADKERILPFGPRLHIRQLQGRGIHRVEVSRGGQIRVVNIEGSATFIHPGALVSAQYPDLSKAFDGDLSGYRPGLVGAFNPDYIKLALNSASTRPRFEGIAFYHRVGENAALSANLFTTPGGFGLLMPIRATSNLKSHFTKDFGVH